MICVQINYVFSTNFISPHSISQVWVLPMLRYKRRGYVYFFIDVTPHPFPFQQHPPSTVYTSIPSSDKAVPQNKDWNITRWPKLFISIGILWDHHHTQSITDQNVAMSYITSFISVLPWTGGHWHWREGSHIPLFFAWHCEDFVTIPKINTTLSWSHNYFVIEKAY